MQKPRLRRKKFGTTNDLIPTMTGQKPFWKSKTLQGLAVVAVGLAASKFGWGLTDADQANLVADLSQIIGLVYAWYGRITAKEKLTK